MNDFQIKVAERKGTHRNAKVRRMALLCLQKKMKQKDVAKQFKISVRTLRRWKHEWEHEQKISPGVSTGRPRTLWDEPIRRILSTLEENSSATNKMLSDLTDNMVSPQSISNYLKREDYIRKRNTKKIDECLIEIPKLCCFSKMQMYGEEEVVEPYKQNKEERIVKEARFVARVLNVSEQTVLQWWTEAQQK